MQNAKGKAKNGLNRPRAAPCYRAQNHRTPRRGIILLVVLLLLALLSVTLLTLVMVTAQARLSAKAAARAQPPEPPIKLLNQAFAQVVRGSTDSDSVIGAHSLLEDLYGNGGLTGQIVSTPVVGAGGAVAEFNVAVALAANQTPPGSGFYGGRVWTALTGPARGQSARVVSSSYATGAGVATLRIITPGGILPAAGDQFLINGRPFSGTGFGFQPATFPITRLLDALDPTFLQPLALLPNHASFIGTAAYSDPAGPGGANEDYDAADFQNMLLALQLPSTGGSSASSPSAATILPSLHRPELANFWINTAPGLWASADFQRRVVLRPLTADHPDFTGGNPAFDPVNGPWDVDNDGDGAPDSIWVDLGFGVRFDRRGKPYKPLFAILCVDLDGRLNLNAHGNLNHLDPPRNAGQYGPFAVPPGTNSQTSVLLPCGQGYGVAEINLGAIFGQSELQALLTGNLALGIEGRYGELHRLDANLAPVPPRPGWAGEEDLLNRLQQFEFPQAYANVAVPGDFGTPPDLDDDGKMALDLRGQPYYVAYAPTAGWGEPGERIDDPYEFNQSSNVMEARRQLAVAGADGTAPIDARFTPGELSAVLRYGDVDAASLAGRLLNLAPTAFGSSANRRRVTTDSWDVPVPSLLITSPDLMAGAASLAPPGAMPRLVDSSLTEMLRARMIQNGFAGDFATAATVLLAPESRAGLRLDLNRPLGDGADDNGNYVVDEPAEAALESSWSSVYGSPVAFDLNDDGQIDALDMQARQILARHLYVLLMLFKDQAFFVDPDNDQQNQERETARWLAQWAVNVVDYRDRDSIMTAFEYDYRPFNGWNVDGNPATQEPESDVVWGCERPQLLITETLAFHDRATEDLPDFGLTSDGTDSDFDQRYMPEGSLFVELYNPWSAADAPPSELSSAGAPLSGGIDLSLLAPVNSQGGQSPVWRLLIAKLPSPPPNSTPDPDAPSWHPFTGTIERSVYFTNPTASGITGDGQEYYALIPGQPIFPDQYAVIGPDPLTYVGRRTDGKLAKNPRIALSASSASPVMVSDNTSAGPNTPSPGDIKQPVAIIVNKPRRLNVSEPVNGYTQSPPVAGGSFNPPINQPLDETRADLAGGGADRQAIATTGTTPAFRVVYLQRLANPMAAYDPLLNPYRTIDAMPVDLTSFTGRSANQGDTPFAQQKNGQAKIAFAARQRGDFDAQNQTQGQGSASGSQPLAPKNQLWAQEPLTTAPIVEPPSNMQGTYYFPYPVRQTLGFLNTAYFQNFAVYYASDGSGYETDADQGQFWKSANPAPTGGTVPPQLYAGDPERAFPWLAWNNRPYTGAFELLTVPACQSSQLLSVYSLLDSQINAYSPTLPQYHDVYHQQLSFFGASPLVGPSGAAANLYRFFEFVGVPSRFIATDTYQNPALFSGATVGTDDLHPPFNHVSTYREPGRVNVNTMLEKVVWSAVVDGFPGAESFGWTQLVVSRSGNRFITNNQGNAYSFSPTFPTLFARPFRSFAGAPLVPLASMRPLSEVEATLLRPTATLNLGNPLFSNTSTDPWNESSRNPYFRYQLLQKLSNLLTTRSNIYAVWITMGTFDVEPVAIDGAHPDGYCLAAERGSDTGQTTRHRAFYLYDRTVPVGFQRGNDLNVDDGVLVRQLIE